MTNHEIKATVLSEKHRWGDTVILLCEGDDRSLVSVKTKAEDDEMTTGLTYLFIGHWTETKYGRQFSASSWVQTQPHGETGIVSYLMRAPNVGLVTAKALWALYKGDAVRKLREEPEAVALAVNKRGFTEAKALEAADHLVRECVMEDTEIDLVNLFTGKGYPRTTIKTAIKKWGAKAALTIRKNPYSLMQFPGIGFNRADVLYLELGKRPAAMKRQTLCAWHAIHSDSDGHTWFDPDYLNDVLKAKIGGTDVNTRKALRLGLRARLLAKTVDAEGKTWVTDASRSLVESQVAERVAHMLSQPPIWPDVAKLADLSDHQRERLAQALKGRIALFGGSPGTGKTHTASRLIGELIQQYGGTSVAVCAPTGKAAVRITEFMKNFGLNLRARTIHGYLGVLSSDGGWQFEHGEDNPVDERFVVVDEASMVDSSLMASLLSALPATAHLLLVGDIQQLPPVGHGAPLRDLIRAGVPSGELTEIRRNSGAIVETCAAIRDQRELSIPLRLSPETGGNIALLQADDGQQMAERIMRTVRKIRDQGLEDPIWSVQVVCAVNEKTPVSRVELNKLLQAELNAVRGTTKFLPGDKVVALKNRFWPAVSGALDDPEDDEGWDESLQRESEYGDPQFYVANGEIGRCVEDLPNKLILEFFSPRRLVLIPRGEGGGDLPFDLGYAISVHKCVAGDTLVETDRGLLRIDRLGTSATQIATPDGGMAFGDYVTNPPGALLRIKTEHGYEVTVTPDHGLWSWTGERYEKRFACELKAGDFLRLRLGATVEPDDRSTLPVPDPRPRATWYKTPRMLNAEGAEFLGLMVADGTVWERGFRLLKRYPEVGRRFRDLCRMLFDVEPREVNAEGAVGYEVDSTYLADWLRKVGGMSPNEKAIPWCVLAASSIVQAAFLRGLFEDGTVSLKDGTADHIEFSTVYPEMAKTVQMMLLRLGVVSTRRMRPNGLWCLYIYSTFIKEFANKVGFIARVKSHRAMLPVGKSKFLVPVARQDTFSFSMWTKQNTRLRGYATRAALDKEWPEAEGLQWHHVRVVEIEKTEGPSYCVAVPGCGRFLQNGFDGSNSQGSEWPVVIVALDDSYGARMVSDRSWIYTAISRAKKVCLLVGQARTIRGMVSRQKIHVRKTFLVERLAESRKLYEVKRTNEAQDIWIGVAPAVAPPEASGIDAQAPVAVGAD